MKKCLLFVLFLSCILGFHGARREENIPCKNLYEILSKESFGPFDKEKLLYLNVGIDYIPYELIELFEKLTEISVIVDFFDSNEILEAKLLAGGVQYDLVFPTAWPHFSRQLTAGIYQKVDKGRVNYKMFDRDILKRLAQYDAGNEYALPYQFGISGISLDEKVIDAVATGAPKNSLAIVFDPYYAEKISKYGVSLHESPDELFPSVLAFLGLDPETEREEDIIKAFEHLKKIRKYISKFSSYGFEDLASGNACAALCTSGDIFKIKSDNKKSTVKFFLPKEGASLWVDVIAIPAGAKHTNNIYAFLKFLLHPQVIAYVTNNTARANAVSAAAEYVDEDLIKDSDVYPDAEVRRKCYIEKPSSPKMGALKARLLTKIKSAGTECEF